MYIHAWLNPFITKFLLCILCDLEYNFNVLSDNDDVKALTKGNTTDERTCFLRI